MDIDIYQVDAFAEKPFEGNPAAVCPLKEWLDDEILQNIAKENNLSETAFFLDKGNYYELRWFTPGSEVDLCGHATMATSHVIFNTFNPGGNKIEFQTKSGKLIVEKTDDLYSMNFPSRPPVPCDRDDNIIKGLGIEPKSVYESRDYMAVYESEKQVRELDPDMNYLVKGEWTGIIATAKSEKFDFVSRFFAPGEGIPEDPVTGSAFCTLAPYWSKKLGKKEMRARQISPRGGNVRCRHSGERVDVMGSAVFFMNGKIKLDLDKV